MARRGCTVAAILALMLAACATGSEANRVSPVSAATQTYFSELHGKIVGCVQLPPTLSAEQKRLLEVKVRIVVEENGEVRSATIDKSSGSSEYDETILQAIHCAQPFGRPDAESGRYVARGLVLSFKP